MGLGEKILVLRERANLSQEQLAEKMAVSRQTVSKWETGQALPQIEKVLQLCDLFNVSCDQMLKDDIEITSSKKNKYFGTDGFRGEANVALTSMHAYRVGRFLGWYFSTIHGGGENRRPRIVIGKDTRRSSYMLEYSISAGITASGADVYMLHVTTTPSVSYVTRQEGFDCGIMITASHNPFYDNGIKIINKNGEKIDDEVTSLIESYIDGDMQALGISEADLPFAKKEQIGCIEDYVSGRNRYMGYLISVASHSYKNFKIGLDCANGASWMIAKSVFGALGAQLTIMGNEPNGLNVNLDCGSTHLGKLAQLVKENGLDMGFAFDGDADRCLAIDEHGNIIDGDAMLYILSKRLKRRGMLNGDTIVATIMSNSGLIKSLAKWGIKTEQTAVGDRFVYEKMQSDDYKLGGEQSGHIILKKYATTGDGILTALMLLEEVCDTKLTLSELVKDLKVYPQKLKNVRVRDKAETLEDEDVGKALKEVEELIAGNGRVLLRQSGTEPKIRIMVEADTEELCDKYIAIIYNEIVKKGYKVD